MGNQLVGRIPVTGDTRQWCESSIYKLHTLAKGSFLQYNTANDPDLEL